MRNLYKKRLAFLLALALAFGSMSTLAYASEAETEEVTTEDEISLAVTEEGDAAESIDAAEDESAAAEETTDAVEEYSEGEEADTITAESESDTLAASTVASGTCGANLTWTLNSSGVLTISGSGAMYDYNYEFDEWPEWYNYNVTSVIIGDKVTSVGDYAFCNLENIQSAVIGAGVKTIGMYAFSGCYDLENVTLGNNIVTIDEGAFCSTGLTDIEFGNNVVSIGESAFENCWDLTSVIIPDNVTTIGNRAFAWCTELKSVSLGNGVTYIGEKAFVYCTNLTSVSIGSSVTTIAYAAFRDCESLMKVTIPKNVTSIDKMAFGYVSDDYVEVYDEETDEYYLELVCDLVDGFTITGYYGTVAEAYAVYNNIAFVGLGSTSSATGVIKGPDGNWYYYVNGKIQTDYTGFQSNKNGDWYIEKGKVTFTTNGVFKDSEGTIGTKGTWYYVVGSKVQYGYTGVANYKNANGWWYIKKGKVDFTANTVAKNKNGWWYVVGGKVQFSYTGVSNYKNSSGWWYIKKGKVDFTYTGKAKNKYGTWNVVKGKVVF